MPPLHAGQWAVKKSKARFKVLSCGRRWGKTFLGALTCMEVAAEGGTAWWVAPDYPRAKIAWRMIIKLCTQIPGVLVNKGEAIIAFPGGGYIQLKSAMNPDSLRGEGLHLVVIDECADVPEVAWFEALRPTLTDFQGSALFIGTPKGRNWFHTLWKNAKDLPGWEAFQMPTWTNPYIRMSELEAAKRELPDRTFRQEYGAQFVTFAGRVYENFDPDGPMVFSDLDMALYHSFWGGIDFGFRNPTAIVIAGETQESSLDIIHEVYERRLTNADVITIVKDLTDEYDIRQWWGDASNPGMIQELEDAGIPVEPSPRSSGGQGTFVQWEIRLVAGRLEEKPIPSLRFLKSCEMTIKEHDGYRYAKVRPDSEEKESPIKKDDHSVNSCQYLVHGLDEWYGWAGGTIMSAGTREAQKLPR